MPFGLFEYLFTPFGLSNAAQYISCYVTINKPALVLLVVPSSTIGQFRQLQRGDSAIPGGAEHYILQFLLGGESDSPGLDNVENETVHSLR